MWRTVWIASLLSALTMFALTQGAAAGLRGDLGVNVNDNMNYAAPASVDSVSGFDTLNGTRWWDFEIEDYDVAATNPMIGVDSGFPASAFPYLGASSFPVFGAPQATLNPGDSYFPGLNLQSTIPVTFSSGFNETRSVSPTTIPAGGGAQDVTLTVTPLVTTGFYKVGVSGPVDGATVTASSGPTNLDQGESLSVTGGGSGFVLFNPQVGKLYSFSFTLSVPNPFGTPFVGKPNTFVIGINGSSSCCLGPASSVTIPDATLNGQITYSVDQTVANWSVNHYDGKSVSLQGFATILPPTSTSQCKKDDWPVFGMFKNQGDCVSYVATQGNNASSG